MKKVKKEVGRKQNLSHCGKKKSYRNDNCVRGESVESKFVLLTPCTHLPEAFFRRHGGNSIFYPEYGTLLLARLTSKLATHCYGAADPDPH